MGKYQDEVCFYLQKRVEEIKQAISEKIEEVFELSSWNTILSMQEDVLPAIAEDFVYDSFSSYRCPYCEKLAVNAQWKEVQEIGVVRHSIALYETTPSKCAWALKLLMCPSCGKISTWAWRDVNWDQNCEVPDSEVFVDGHKKSMSQRKKETSV